MNSGALKERFFELVPPPRPNEWEVEESLDRLLGLSASQQEMVLNQIPAIWPVSNSLCYSYLASAGPALQCLAENQITAWVAAILDTYEQQGLRQAQQFMADAEANYLCRLRGETGVELASLPQLRLYAQGLLRRPIRLAIGREAWTDTETIYLPAKISHFASQVDNFLYYKLLLTFQAGLIDSNSLQFTFPTTAGVLGSLRETYGLDTEESSEPLNLSGFFRLFPSPVLAADLFALSEAWRLRACLASRFQGLWRDSAALRKKLLDEQPELRPPTSLNAIIENLRYLVLAAPDTQANAPGDERYQAIAARFREAAEGPTDSAHKTVALYALVHTSPGTYRPAAALPWIGRLRPDEAWLVKLRQREGNREKFIQVLATILANHPDATTVPKPPAPESPPAATKSGADATAALVTVPGKKEPDNDQPQPERHGSQELVTLTGAGAEPEIPEALRQLAAEIGNDLGQIPAEYISAAQGLAGRGTPAPGATRDGQGERLKAPVLYDEWDYRRSGYRRDWCAVNEINLQPVKSSLVERTLDKYRGQLRQLRKQFELLRAGERFQRRQRDGTDIDLDQFIEALSDRRAGRAGSEQLFIRLCRDQRDIAVLFLVDMSSSTEGWINQALQEALILTGEALHSIGDRFAIAGFSGMRRTRTDIYRVKDFAEPYNDEIKGRIGAMAPKEYTRMGPALRHANRLLQKIEARSRLLVVLSDGKPEDYDDYKGRYAIEDTRHALIEAKAAGIHPFCITIDRQAQDYMGHMYGEINYIFLDDVRKLPLRLPAIYRTLTT
jgi:nitric oxide reductase NorD protein